MEITYKKRTGTSGIGGHLYETKFVSLLLFRLLHHNGVEDFCLASNMEDIGSFDDVCVKIKMKGCNRPIVLFIQMKHKENDDKTLMLNSNDLMKLSESITKIKRNFGSNANQDIFFNESFDDVDCMFILYTNAKYDFDEINRFKASFVTDVNNLIMTGAQPGINLNYTEKDVAELSASILKENIKVLGERFAKYLLAKDQKFDIMNDDHVEQYHVILAQKVVNISEVQYNDSCKWRNLTFRSDFLDTNDKSLSLLRKYLYEQILVHAKKRKVAEEDTTVHTSTLIDEQISTFLSNPSVITLSPLIDNHIIYKNNKLHFVLDRPRSDEELLENVKMSPSQIDESKSIAAKNILSSIQLKVPVTFGNKDLAIRGCENKVKRRISHLTGVIIDLCKKSKYVESYKIISIDETTDEALLSSNGGLGGCVGNVFIYDENSKLFKFTQDEESLQDNAKTLLLQLKNEINHLDEYRIVVKATKFPKLSLNCSRIARDFLSKLVLYAKQGNHNEVEEILNNDIRVQLSTNLDNFPVDSNAIFIHYHHEIQQWWMLPQKGLYLTKVHNIYEKALHNIIKEKQMYALQCSFYTNKIKKCDCIFKEEATKSLQIEDEFAKIMIVSDLTTLTTIKVIQLLINGKNYHKNTITVLDMESILNISSDEFAALNIELKKTDKVLIIVCDVSSHNSERLLHKRLDYIAESIEDKKVIIIASSLFSEVVKEYFPEANSIIEDKKLSLTDFTQESQMYIKQNTQIIFQGQKVNVDILLDDESAPFINGIVLNKMICNETIYLGKPLSDARYEEMKHCYINRRINLAENDVDVEIDDTNFAKIEHVYYNDVNNFVNSFDDINKNVVLLTAKPGMGKSTLLSHMSLKTKELDASVCILKINLIDHSKIFYKWMKNGTDIKIREALNFICQVLLENYDISVTLGEINDKICLDECMDDDWEKFELNMFLHSYNQGKVIFLFDGFDEICPHYKEICLEFLEVLINHNKINKIWVTSRPYNDILPDLQTIIANTYQLQYIDETDQELLLENIWRSKLTVKLCDFQFKNIKSFTEFVPKIKDKANDPMAVRFKIIASHFVTFINKYTNLTENNSGKDSDENVMNCNNEVICIKESPKAAICEEIKFRKADTFIGTPLHLFLFANYIINLIFVHKNNNKWDVDVNIFIIYETFIETKLKNILFEDKNKMDIYNPDIIEKYKKERNDCISMHKKLAAYAQFSVWDAGDTCIFREEFKDVQPFPPGRHSECEAMLSAIRSGKEKTGLISHVTLDDIPVFIHKSFQDYFTAEFLCDVLKSDKDKLKKKLLYNMLYLSRKLDTNIMPWINKKREIDAELDGIIRNIIKEQPFFTNWLRSLCNSYFLEHWTIEHFTRIACSSSEDYETDVFSKYDEEFFFNQTSIHTLDGRTDEDDIEKYLVTFIAKMKPELKKYFESVCW